MKLFTSLGMTITLLAAWAGLDGAQSLPRLTPIPPRDREVVTHAPVSGPWQALTNQPTFLVCGAANPLLLTDGTVLVQDAGCQDWWRLAPDKTGSYVNGTWSQIASLPDGYSPLYHSSAVLRDGRVIIEGGEYNFFTPVWTNQGAIYDPLANTWTSVEAPSGWSTIGDAQSVILANGTYMQANCCSKQAALLDSKTLTWTPTGANKADINDEEGWNLLPDGTVLTVDAGDISNSERYFPKRDIWKSAGSTIAPLVDAASYEIGPAVLRPDGTVFYLGLAQAITPTSKALGRA